MTSTHFVHMYSLHRLQWTLVAFESRGGAHTHIGQCTSQFHLVSFSFLFPFYDFTKYYFTSSNNVGLPIPISFPFPYTYFYARRKFKPVTEGTFLRRSARICRRAQSASYHKAGRKGEVTYVQRSSNAGSVVIARTSGWKLSVLSRVSLVFFFFFSVYLGSWRLTY